jgi:hypothetical protein
MPPSQEDQLFYFTALSHAVKLPTSILTKKI